MVTFKEGWYKLYYTQHTLLSDVGQLPFFFRNKQTHTHTHTHTHIRERKNDSNIKAYHNSTQLAKM